LQGHDSPTGTEDDLEPALQAVRQAGELALGHFGSRVKAWRKADGTPLSDVDLAVDDHLRRELARERPRYGWHSEESHAPSEMSQRFWLVDPIDGTAAFLQGNDSWCISLALIEDGRPILGIIHAPAKKSLYSAARNRGAKLNGTAIKVSGRQDLEGSRLIMNASALKPEHWHRALPDVKRASVPSLALRLAHVAEGAADAALALSYKHDWDLAAGDVLIGEAQGIMGDLDGDELRYDDRRGRRKGFIGASPQIHAALMAHGPIAIGPA
jgi:myo-inositol-1(or 4)-monophosphatase